MTIVRHLLKLPRPIRFIAIGGLAAATHFLSVILLVEALHLNPLIANVIAFLIAFTVSFSGQRLVTFQDSQQSLRTTLSRYFLISVCSFIANEILFAISIKLFQLPYIPALAGVLILVAAGTYMTSRKWAFKV